jgi:hypothetical protein
MSRLSRRRGSLDLSQPLWNLQGLGTASISGSHFLSLLSEDKACRCNKGVAPNMASDTRRPTGRNNVNSHFIGTGALLIVWDASAYYYVSLYLYLLFYNLKTDPYTSRDRIMLDLRFSQRWIWRALFTRMYSRVVRWKSTEVSVEHITSIFRVEE